MACKLGIVCNKTVGLGFSDEGYILPPMHITSILLKAFMKRLLAKKTVKLIVADTNNSLVEEAKKRNCQLSKSC